MAIKSIWAIFIFSILCSIDVRSCVINNQGGIRVNVLATVLPPFTGFNVSRGIENGVDVLILKTIATRLHFEINFTKAHDFGRIPIDSLK